MEAYQRKEDIATEGQQVTTAAEEKDVILVAEKTASRSDFSHFNPSAIFSEALKPFSRIVDCSFREILNALDTNEDFLMNKWTWLLLIHHIMFCGYLDVLEQITTGWSQTI